MYSYGDHVYEVYNLPTSRTHPASTTYMPISPHSDLSAHFSPPPPHTHTQYAGRSVDADISMLLSEIERIVYSYGDHVYEVPHIVAVKRTYDRVSREYVAVSIQLSLFRSFQSAIRSE